MGPGQHEKPLPNCFFLTVKWHLLLFCLACWAGTTEAGESHNRNELCLEAGARVKWLEDKMPGPGPVYIHCPIF